MKEYSYTTAITALLADELLPELLTNFGIPELYYDDLLQEIYLIILDYNQNKIEQIYNKGDMKFFLVRIIQNQYFSRNSPFYMKYKRFNQMKDENYTNNDNPNETERDYE